MASIDTTRTATGISAGSIVAFVTRGFATVAAWNDARITRKSLSQLSARELDDIGLTYGDIDDVASGGLRR